jgi:hypothetical protein
MVLKVEIATPENDDTKDKTSDKDDKDLERVADDPGNNSHSEEDDHFSIDKDVEDFLRKVIV